MDHQKPKVRFRHLLSRTKFFTSIAYKLKQLLQYFITFVTVAPFSTFVCKLARVTVLTSCGSAES